MTAVQSSSIGRTVKASASTHAGGSEGRPRFTSELRPTLHHAAEAASQAVASPARREAIDRSENNLIGAGAFGRQSIKILEP